VNGAAVLRQLHDAGVEVVFEAPDQIRLRGPLTPELVELARDAKPELLALAQYRVMVVPCSCCGRFFFAEPATVCFWCRSPIRGDKRYESTCDRAEGDTSVPSVPAFPEPQEKRACPGCGGDLAAADPEDGPCWSCRQVTGGAQ
jgi:hypothetical protein